jgi:hypothetical protein
VFSVTCAISNITVRDGRVRVGQLEDPVGSVELVRILLLVLAIVGAAGWLWLGAAPTTPRASDGAGGATDAPGPTLAARPASVPAPPTREVGTDAPPTDRASAIGNATIVGRVHAATRVRAGVEAVVFVTTGNGGSDVLAQAIVGSDGAYRISMAVPSSDGIDVELGARVPGALAGFARLHVRAGDVVRHDLALARGSTIAGRVLDSHGNAMAGLELMANSPRVLGMTSRVGRLFRTVRPGRLLSSSGASYHEGRAFTGPDGRFEMTGLPEGEYTFWTPSSEWMVRQTERVPAPSVGVTLVVDPLAGFSIRVLDDASGNELRSFDGMAEIAAGVQRTAMPVRSEEGADEFLWRELDAERTQGCEVTLRMGSPGYETRVEVFGSSRASSDAHHRTAQAADVRPRRGAGHRPVDARTWARCGGPLNPERAHPRSACRSRSCRANPLRPRWSR